jgi:putative pyruvate formate lyase activating enzyme
MDEKIKFSELLFSRPDAVYTLEDEDVKRVLKRYVNVVNNKLPTKFLLLKSFEVEIPKDVSLEELWKLHDSLMKEFKEKEQSNGKFFKTNLLTLKRIIASQIVKKCQLCEWNCEVDRTKGQKGVCQVGEHKN